MDITRTVASAAAGAMVVGTGALLGASTATAAQVTITTSYDCTTSLGARTFDTTIAVDAPASAITGTSVASRTATIKATIPSDLVSTLKLTGANAISGTASDASFRVGSQAVPLSAVTIPTTPLPESGSVDVTATGTFNAFTAPAPGAYDVKVPTGFTLNLRNQNGGALSPVPCTLTTGANELVGPFTATAKVATTTTAKLKKKPVRTTKKAKVLVTVAATGVTPTGEVTVTEGAKVLGTATLKAGAAKVKLPKLTAGKHKVVVAYDGDDSTTASTVKLKIKVKAKK